MENFKKRKVKTGEIMSKVWTVWTANDDMETLLVAIATSEEKAMDISRWYGCSYAMAEKVVWIICGDCARQIKICNTLGKEYALYVPTGCQ